MTEASHVDYAKPSDAEGIYDLLVMMHAEIGTFALSEKKVRGLVDRCVRRDRAIAGVVRHEGQVVGAIGMIVDAMYYTDEDSLIEQFNFVRPDARRAHHATNLIAFAKTCSDKLGMPLLIGVFDASKRIKALGKKGVGNNEGRNRVEAKLRFYERYLTPAGAFFTHNMDASHVR